MPPRLIVFGYGPLGLAALDAFESLGVIPIAVVVPGNRLGADVDMVSARARERSLPVLVQPKRPLIEPFLDQVRALKPDVMFVWSYTLLLPPALVALAAKGTFNIHSGILPQYRGGHVVNWAIANGERESAATLHYIDDGVDTGDVVGQQRFPIDFDDDIMAVQRKIKAAGTELIKKWWPAIAAGTAPRQPQDETLARHYRMRTPEDGRIDWSRSNVQIYNLVRALVAPWPGAFIDLNGARIVFRAVEPIDFAGALPGSVLKSDDDGVVVGTGDGAIRVRRAEIAGAAAGPGELRAAGLIDGAKL